MMPPPPENNTNPQESSYIDYEAFLDPSFSAASFANKLVLSTNNPTDTPLDLSTPLSKVLFDVQEVDTHIDTLTNKNALPLIDHVKVHSEASAKVLSEMEGQVSTLNESYQRLQKEVIERHEAADQVRLAAERLTETLKLGRNVARCLVLTRQLEAQLAEVKSPTSSKGENNQAMIRVAETIIYLREMFASTTPKDDALMRVQVITQIKNDIITPGERHVMNRAQQIVREFSMSSLSSTSTTSEAANLQQIDDQKSRTTAALTTLYLLSHIKPNVHHPKDFDASLFINALQTYLQTALTASLAALSRALSTLPTLDKTLLEISARCQNIVALEALLESTKIPHHPLLEEMSQKPHKSKHVESRTHHNLLELLVAHLDTSSLASYFWRSLASSLSQRVQEILQRGGISARTLRTNKERVSVGIRECVNRGSQLPSHVVLTSSNVRKEDGVVKTKTWAQEAAVMVGAVIGPLTR